MKLARLPDGSPEIFHTLQGEGISQGRPAVFIRASLCNLHCHWCDTDYTWNWEGTPWSHERDGEEGYRKYRKEEQILELTPAEIAQRVRAFDCRHLVLTGGEPLLQQDGFAETLSLLQEQDGEWTAEVETNGTIAPKPEFDALVAHYNVSPKLANSGMKEDLRISEKALSWFANSSRAWFKFVVQDDNDLAEVRALRERFLIPHDRILLMPEGRTGEALAHRREWLTSQCLALGYRFSDRLHVHLWGSTRGT